MNLTIIPRFQIAIEGHSVGVGTANELSAALDVLQGQHDRSALEQLKPHLADVVANPAGLMAILRSLVMEDQLFLIKAIGHRLGEVVHSAKHLSDIFAMLSSPEVENQILQTLGKEGLSSLIQSADDLGLVLQWLYGSSDTKVLRQLGAARLHQLVKTGSDLAKVLNYLDEAAGQRVLMEMLRWDYVIGITRNGTDLAQMLRAMPSQIGSRLISEMTEEQLTNIIGNEQDFAYLWERLEPAEANALAKKLNITDYAA